MDDIDTAVEDSSDFEPKTEITVTVPIPDSVLIEVVDEAQADTMSSVDDLLLDRFSWQWREGTGE